MSDDPSGPTTPRAFLPTRRPWLRKFGDAWRGIRLGVRGQASFRVHAVAAVLVILLAALLQMTVVQWGLLLLCITIVCAAEMFNSAIEQLARAVDTNVNPRLRDALDIASGAVLVAAFGAAVVGAAVFVTRLIG